MEKFLLFFVVAGGVSAPNNDFASSSRRDANEALNEIDGINSEASLGPLAQSPIVIEPNDLQDREIVLIDKIGTGLRMDSNKPQWLIVLASGYQILILLETNHRAIAEISM